MARRKPTEAQREAARERREKFRQLARNVAALTAEQRQALIDKFGAIVTCEGRALSHFNTCLLIHQLANVSMVGGFQQWKRAGRHVMKGQHGMMIWIPLKGKEGDAPTAEEVEGDKPSFIMGTVFDVTQTSEIIQGDQQEQEEEEAENEA